MKNSRRQFIKNTALTGIILPSIIKEFPEVKNSESKVIQYPITIATWNNKKAIQAAWSILKAEGDALDAVQAGAMVPEADPDDTSVGYGGFPDRDGDVTLDASIMDHKGNAGAVMYLEGIKHPIAVARMVMEKTPHVFLAGSGAKQFALENGFIEENLLTEKAKQAWENWKLNSKYEPKINSERHDTIGILAQDSKGNIAGACSTSGLAFKMKGRVGDSPIIGAGLYVDNEVGAATATGLGEAVVKKVGAFSIVEMMRTGMSPQMACEAAVKRLLSMPNHKDLQVGYIAINNLGQYGGFSLQPGFQFYLIQKGKAKLVESKSYFKNK